MPLAHVVGGWRGAHATVSAWES